MTEEPPLKPVVWVGSSRKDLRKFPDPVQHQVGYAIYIAQRGGKHRDTKVLTGFAGAGVLEVVEDFRGDTLCVARVSKEIEKRTRDASPRHGAYRAAAARGRTDSQGRKS